MVSYGASSFMIRLLTFALKALWEEACCIEYRSSFYSFGPEYGKVFLKSSVYLLSFFFYIALTRKDKSILLRNMIGLNFTF